jgi:crossover junction endodeoxyribonuclease RusA
VNVELVVPGVPEPKGSYHLQRRGLKSWIVPGSSATMKNRMDEWAFRVHHYAKLAATANRIPEPYDEPFAADLTFYLPRPKSAPKRLHCAVKPDLDKLVRGALDPLKRVLITEDSRLVSLSARKVYADAESPPGVRISIWSVGW